MTDDPKILKKYIEIEPDSEATSVPFRGQPVQKFVKGKFFPAFFHKIENTEYTVNIIEPKNYSNDPRKILGGKFSTNKRYRVSPKGVILDTKNGLEWFIGPDEDINHYQVEKWAKGLNVNGGGWRLPTRIELWGIYQEGQGGRNIDPVFKMTDWWVWTGELMDNSSVAYAFDFRYGRESCRHRSCAYHGRGFSVRSGR